MNTDQALHYISHLSWGEGGGKDALARYQGAEGHTHGGSQPQSQTVLKSVVSLYQDDCLT